MNSILAQSLSIEPSSVLTEFMSYELMLVVLVIVAGIVWIGAWINRPHDADLSERVWDLEQQNIYLGHVLKQLILQVDRLEKGERDVQ